MSTFNDDLKRANEDEQTLCYALEQNGCTDATMNISDDYETLKAWDISFTGEDGISYSGELKTDYKYTFTNNIAVELSCNGKPSGLITTAASYWFYKLGEDFYWFLPATLYSHIYYNQHRLRFVNGGDRGAAYLALVPLNEFLTIATKLPKK